MPPFLFFFFTPTHPPTYPPPGDKVNAAEGPGESKGEEPAAAESTSN